MKPMKCFYRKQNSEPCTDRKVFSDTRGVSTTDIIITVAAIIIIIVSITFLVMKAVNLRDINREINEIKATIELKRDALSKLIELGQSEDELKENYEQNQLSMPAEKNEIGIISDITSIVLNADAALGKITFLEETAVNDGIIGVPFVVKVECTYDILSSIIDKFGTAERLYIIESLVVMDSDMASDELTSDLLMHAYYRKN